MTLYEKYCGLDMDFSRLSLERGDTEGGYFCDPVGAEVIGWAGVDGIHCCFVEGFGDPADRRVKLVRITAAGEACCRQAEQDMERTETELLSGLTEAERTIFLTLLKKVRDTLQ